MAYLIFTFCIGLPDVLSPSISRGERVLHALMNMEVRTESALCVACLRFGLKTNAFSSIDDSEKRVRECYETCYARMKRMKIFENNGQYSILYTRDGIFLVEKLQYVSLLAAGNMGIFFFYNERYLGSQVFQDIRYVGF